MKRLFYVLFFASITRIAFCNIRNKRQGLSLGQDLGGTVDSLVGGLLGIGNTNNHQGLSLGQDLGGTVDNLVGGLLGVGNTNNQQGCDVNNGGCAQGCTVVQSSVQCYCFPGFAINGDRRTCSDVDECSSGLHICQDTCINTVGSYLCSCSNGELLSDGRSCSQGETLSCSINNGGCDQECTEKSNGDISCKCGKGYKLANDKKSCSDIDECSNGRKCRPGNTCFNTDGGFECMLDGIMSCRVRNGGCEHICRDTKRGVRCKCRKGFILQRDFKQCRPARGECAAKNRGCAHICRPNGKKTECSCRNGYELHKNGRSCTARKGKAIPDGPCQNNNGGCDQICVDDGGSAKCECNDGFVRTQGLCEKITSETRPEPHIASQSQQQRGCGINMKKTTVRRIVGGKPADPKDWPWMAALLRKSGSQFCGGVLITDRHVLTAAHCVVQFTKNDIKVRLGEYNFDNPDENNPTDFGVEEIRSHENYNAHNQDNDIAIIKLDRPSSFDDFIWPVCLPPPNEDFERNLGFVTGWGTIYFGGPVSEVLQEVLLPVWKQSDCAAAYPENAVTRNMMCAGLKEGGKDSCQGDSGGPFLVQIQPNPRWYVAGVVSWGIECATQNRPGVYTRVNKYLDWIKANALF